MPGIYPIQYKAPDLSDIYKIAKNTGRNQGLVAALEGELDFRRDLYKQRAADQAAAAKKRAAAAAASSDPENESFWDKLDQFGKDIVDKQERALSWTFDKIQRPMYGAINAFEEMNNQAYDEDRGFFDMSGTGEVIDKFWKGFKGEEKKTFSSVIASEAAENKEKNIWDHKGVQAAVGFVGDVAFDPLTYVGAGLVTKPLKAAKGARENTRLNDLSREIEKLGVKPGKEAEGFDHDVPLTADEIRAMLSGTGKQGRYASTTAQRAENIRVATQNLPRLKKWIRETDGIDAPEILSKLEDEIKRVEASRVAILDDMGQKAYKEALDEFDRNPRLWPGRPKGESLIRPEDSVRSVTQTADAFKAGFFKGQEGFDEVMGEGWKLDPLISPEFRANAREMVDRLVKKDPDMHKYWEKNRVLKGQLTEAKRKMNAAKGSKSYNNLKQDYDRINKAVKANYRDIEIAKASTFHKLVDFEKNKNLNNGQQTLTTLKAKEQQAISKRNKATTKAEKSNAQVELDAIRDQINQFKSGDEMSALLAREWELQHLLKTQGKAGSEYEVAGHVPNSEEGFLPKLITDEAQRGKEIPETSFNQDRGLEVRLSDDIEDLGRAPENPLDEGLETASIAPRAESIINDPVKELTDELFRVQKEIEKRLKDKRFRSRGRVPRPEGMPENFKVTKAWLDADIADPKVAEYQRIVRREVQDLADDIFKSKKESWLREGRQIKLEEVFDKNKDTRFALDKLRKMFAPPAKRKNSVFSSKEHIKENFAQPYITINGVKVFRSGNTPEAQEALAKFINAEDAAQAAQASATKSGSATTKKLQSLEDELTTAKTSADNIDNDVAQQAHWDKEVTRLTEEIDNILKGGSAAVKPEYIAFERLFKEQHGMRLASALRYRRTAVADAEKYFNTVKVKNRNFTKEVENKLRGEAETKAMQTVQKQIDEGSLRGQSTRDLKFEAYDVDKIEDTWRAAKDSERVRYAQAVAETKAQKLDGVKQAEIDKQLEALKADHRTRLNAYNRAYREAEKTRKAMDERLDEQLLLDILEENIQNQGNFLKLTYAGINLGEFRSPVAIMEKMGDLPILKQANAAWAKAFRPASSIEPELNLARLRAQAATPQIIKHHVDDIRHRFSKFKPEERRAALKSLKSGVPVGNPALFKAMEEYFEEMMPYLTGKVGITDDAGKVIDPLEIKDINQYLPPKYKFVEGKSFNSVQDALNSMTNLPHTEDAMRVMWYLRVAQEQALSQKAFKHTIKSIYGVARPDKTVLRKIKKGEEVPQELLDQDKIITSLGKEHGWRTVGGLDDTHYFAPEVADDIDKLVEMMKPQNVNEIIQKYDKVIRAWKTTVTIYNPGYYVRNGIGEFMTGWFDNVSDPKWYFKAGQVIKYAMPDAMDDTLKQLEPWKKHQTINQKGARKITKKKYNVNGEMRELTADDIWVLYNDVGLKSGFISSEFEHFFPAAGSVKSTQVGQKLTRANDRFRQGGEKYEDFFRVAHLISRMERSKLTDPLKAAEEASHFVRKYHFDYTDFTPFEKTAMLRLFPFYKWTRKAMPLMVSMAFSKPGKAFAYPKAMHALSVGTGANDPLTDDNGWLPNYEEVTPKWMQDMLAYPIGTDQDNAMTYMNVATPQLDVYKMFGDPVGTTAGMLTPGLKYPLEQTIGHPIDPEFSGMEMKGAEDRFDHTMRLTPATNLLNRLRNEGDPNRESDFGEPAFGTAGGIDEKLLSFLTGLGFYENSKARQQGELMRRGGVNQ